MLSFNSFKGCLDIPEPIARIIYDHWLDLMLPTWQEEHNSTFSIVLWQLLDTTKNINNGMNVNYSNLVRKKDGTTQVFDAHYHSILGTIDLWIPELPGFRIINYHGYWHFLMFGICNSIPEKKAKWNF